MASNPQLPLAKQPQHHPLHHHEEAGQIYRRKELAPESEAQTEGQGINFLPNSNQQPPPPPPPPPAPFPCSISDSGSKTSPPSRNSSSQVSPISNYNFGQASKVEPKFEFKLSGKPSCAFPAQQLSDNFKQDLLQKQAQFSEEHSRLSIDERLQARKQQQLGHQLDSSQQLTSAGSSRMQSLSPSYNQQMPDKLLSAALRQDKRPFAYSPNVSDPNNRGKLDLSQIKSSAMKRRLLANMQSSDEQQEVEDELESGNTMSPISSPSSNVISYHPAEFNVINYRGDNQYNYTQDASQSHSMPNSIKNNARTKSTTTTTIEYNEPPRFYDMHQLNQNCRKPTSRVSDPLGELGVEVAESLESLNQLVSSMLVGGNSYNDQRSRAPVTRQNHQRNTMSYYPQMDTFYPSVKQHYSTDNYATNMKGTSSIDNHMIDSNRRTNTGLVGDYLLSPNSNYFNEGSTGFY